MYLLYNIILILISIQSYLCQNNFTYVLSHINTSEINSVLSSNDYILTNSSYVTRLPILGIQLLNSIQTLLSSNNTQSIVFSSKTSDCSLPIALALKYNAINISSPLCFSDTTSSISNILQLAVTSEQLASAAIIFMNQYSLTYFSIIISESNDFYSNIAQEFSAYLTEKNFISEQILIQSNFLSSSSSSRSKVYYIVCSYNDEILLYSQALIYSKSRSADNIIFIFLRWSPHFVSFYTSQFLPNTSSIGTAGSFPILHLLPIDSGVTSSFQGMVSSYGQILSSTSNVSFTDDIIFILNELESVEYLQPSHSSLSLSPVTLGSNHQRLFQYLLIGRQCNSTWTVFKKITTTSSTFTNIDTNTNLCKQITYPTSDSISTTDTGWQTLRVVLFSLLGVALVCAILLIAFFIIRSRRARTQMSKGPNKIILLPDDLMFVMPKGSIFTSKVNLKNEVHERSNLSMRSDDHRAGKTARFNVSLIFV
ncbi:unnamed protein product [Rotaria magnacalcarata]|uniref:Receptor ligand binding region domain-containing protein n=1 Tax=Rotaria magnacalcarata TaxID=392030 RepID=A0A8S2PVG9_9BILA|nr:unnamed protein product [Rotaria magnacalcarata]CAF4064840.1 unnamed protein product [Rotaria magnacalcarata]